MLPVCDMNCKVMLCRGLIVEWFRCFNESTATNRSFNITTDVPSELDGKLFMHLHDFAMIYNISYSISCGKRWTLTLHKSVQSGCPSRVMLVVSELLIKDGI